MDAASRTVNPPAQSALAEINNVNLLTLGEALDTAVADHVPALDELRASADPGRLLHP